MSDFLQQIEHLKLVASTKKLKEDMKKAQEAIKKVEDRIRDLEYWVDSKREEKYSRED
jgi:hypothetical protein